VRCLDEQRRIREFPANITDIAAPSVSGSCVMSLNDLMSLKELVDAISGA